MQEIRTTKSLNFIKSYRIKYQLRRHMHSANVSYLESEHSKTDEGMKIGERRGARSNNRRSFDENGFASNFVKIWGLPCPLVSPALLAAESNHTNPPYLFTSDFTVQNLYLKIIHQGLINVWHIKFMESSKRLNLDRKIGLTFKFFGIATMSFCFSRLKAWRIAPPKNAVRVCRSHVRKSRKWRLFCIR